MKELTSEKVKLSSIVKMGQDALKVEQDLVKELQQQLSQKVQWWTKISCLLLANIVKLV